MHLTVVWIHVHPSVLRIHINTFCSSIRPDALSSDIRPYALGGGQHAAAPRGDDADDHDATGVEREGVLGLEYDAVGEIPGLGEVRREPEAVQALVRVDLPVDAGVDAQLERELVEELLQGLLDHAEGDAEGGGVVFLFLFLALLGALPADSLEDFLCL